MTETGIAYDYAAIGARLRELEAERNEAPAPSRKVGPRNFFCSACHIGLTEALVAPYGPFGTNFVHDFHKGGCGSIVLEV